MRPKETARLARAFCCPMSTIHLIAQEWERFKARLDSAYPGVRGRDGYLGGLVDSQRGVLDRTIDEAMRSLESARTEGD